MPHLHLWQVSTQTTLPPSLSVQHTDQPISIHAMSAHRPPHRHPCQVSTQPSHLHPYQVSTHATTHPSSQASSQTTVPLSRPGQDPDNPAASMPGHHLDHPKSIHAWSAHRQPYFHQCHISTQTTATPFMPGHHSDYPTSIHARSSTNHLPQYMPGQHTDLGRCAGKKRGVGDGSTQSTGNDEGLGEDLGSW